MTLSDIKPNQMFFFSDIRDLSIPFIVIDEKSPLPDRVVVKSLRNEATYLRRSDEAVQEIGLLLFLLNPKISAEDFPRYYLKADFNLQTNCKIGPDVCNSKSKSYEGFTVMSNIFNRDYSRK